MPPTTTSSPIPSVSIAKPTASPGDGGGVCCTTRAAAAAAAAADATVDGVEVGGDGKSAVHDGGVMDEAPELDR